MGGGTVGKKGVAGQRSSSGGGGMKVNCNFGVIFRSYGGD